MKKSIFTALALFLLVVSSAAHSQDPGTIKEWEAFVAKFIPEVIRDPAAINDLLGAANPGTPFSEVFDPTGAQKVFFDKVIAQQECFFETLPNGELPQEECSSIRGSPLGPDSASQMVYNHAEGSVRYMNRGRDPNPAIAAKLSREDAAKALNEMSKALGIPPQEMGEIQVKDLMAAGGSAGKVGATQSAAPEFSQRIGVFGIIPRCMPVGGQVIKDCIPVADGGIRAAMVDGGRREPAVVTAWYEARYNKFEIPAKLRPLELNEVITRIAEKLSREAALGSYSELQIKVTYATNAELGGQSGDLNCPPDEADEKDPEPTAVNATTELSPPNLMNDRSYLPAVQVFALPVGWESSNTIDPNKLNSYSSGIAVFSVPLADDPSSECQSSREPV